MKKLFVSLLFSVGLALAVTGGAPAYADPSADPSASPSPSASTSTSSTGLERLDDKGHRIGGYTLPDCQAYGYRGTGQTLCDRFAGRGDVDCAEIGYRVTLAGKGTDPWDLDRDGDGFGCDVDKRGRPYPYRHFPSASASAPASPRESASSAAGGGAFTNMPTKGGSGGQGLPVTGVNVPAVLALGGAAVSGGAALYAMVALRRRRTRFMA